MQFGDMVQFEGSYGEPAVVVKVDERDDGSIAPGATKFVACPVALRDIVVRENPQYPTKVKARKCCGLVYEVTIDGERIDRANS